MPILRENTWMAICIFSIHNLSQGLDKIGAEAVCGLYDMIGRSNIHYEEYLPQIFSYNSEINKKAIGCPY
jgi:hypothetical protein